MCLWWPGNTSARVNCSIAQGVQSRIRFAYRVSRLAITNALDYIFASHSIGLRLSTHDIGARVDDSNIGALTIRRGFWAHYSIIIIWNPQTSKVIIQAHYSLDLRPPLNPD